MKRTFIASAIIGLGMCGVQLGGCGGDEQKNPLNSPPPRTEAQPAAPITPPVAAQTPPVVQTPATQPATKQTEVQPSPPPSTLPAEPPTLPMRTPQTPPADPKVAAFAGLTAPKPATWIWRPAQQIGGIQRLAEYGVPGRDGSDQASIVIFQAGGSLDANIERWKMQFRGTGGAPVEPIISKLESDGMPITLVEFLGDYKSMGSPNFVPGQQFLCAVIEAPAGQIFVRFTGPAATVELNRADFMNMIRHLKKVEPVK